MSPTKWYEETKQRFNDLCSEVGARARKEGGKPVLCFDPPLEREEVDPSRWAQALELEDLFFLLCEEKGY